MKVMSYTEARANFAAVLDSVDDDVEEVVIHRAGHEPVVVISLREYESIRETEFLLRDPANAARLRHSIAQLHDGDLRVKTIEELQALVDEAAASAA